MLHWSVRRLKQSKASFVWLCALEFPSSSVLRLPLRTRASWTCGVKSARGRHGLFVMGCCIPHRNPRDFAAVWAQWGWWRDSCNPPPSPPLSSWHLTYWYRGSQLEQTRCVVSQLRRLCLWARVSQSREQVTMNQRLFNSYTYAEQLRGLYSSWFYFSFSVCSSPPTENSTSQAAA